MSVHAFLKKGDSMKQVPLLFCLMSRRKTKDYAAVFKEVKEVLGRVSVEAFMLDFEMAAWKAIRAEFPETLIKGCAFHWSQAVFRKVMNLGLSGVYRERAAGYTYIRRLMALPFLPHGHIEESFDTLKELATTEPLQALVRYMETTWIANPVWPVRTWSVYREVIRTNNDVEGWHRGLNSRAALSHLPFYIIVPLLKKEGQHVTLQHALVTQQLLSEDRRKKFAKVQGRLMTLWDRYAAGEIISSELLQACGRIYGPTEIGVTTIAEDE